MGCAVFHDILKPAAVLLQNDDLCIVNAIEALLKTTKKLKSTPFEEVPSVKMVKQRVKQGENGVSYQGVELVRYDQALRSFLPQFSKNGMHMASCLTQRSTSTSFRIPTK